MSKWEIDDEGDIVDTETREMLIYDRRSLSAFARQIVREHNAHAELVICLKNIVKITCDDCTGDNRDDVNDPRFEHCYLDKKDCELMTRARAAIEAAEGDNNGL